MEDHHSFVFHLVCNHSFLCCLTVLLESDCLKYQMGVNWLQSCYAATACLSTDRNWLDLSCFAPRFANAFSYYGVVLLTTEFLQDTDSCGCKYLAILHRSNANATLHARKYKLGKTKKNNVIFVHLVADSAAKIEPNCSLGCKYLTSSDYRDLLWTTMAEFPGDIRPLSTFSYSSVAVFHF